MLHRRRIPGKRRMFLLLLFVLTFSLLITITGSWAVIKADRLSPQSYNNKNAPMSAGTVTEYPIPTQGGQPVGITSGPDGNLWFTESYNSFTGIDNIGKITTSGGFTEYPLPSAKSEPEGITSGPDGNLWFTEFNSLYGNRIGKITPTGAITITEYALPNADSEPEGITSGPDGNLWFTEFKGNRIGKITTSGQVTEYTVPTADSEPESITSGPCGDNIQGQCLWFTEYNYTTQAQGANIGRITTSGTITEYSLRTQFARANGITLGTNGVLYFTEQINNGSFTSSYVEALIGQVGTSGPVQLSDLPTLPNGGCMPDSITLGSDGNLWFTEYYQIGSISPIGNITEYSLPAGSSSFLPDNITSGSDGNLWFTEYTGNNIGRITTH